MRRFLPILGFVATCASVGCLYLGPVDPCGGEDPISDDLDFAGCDPIVNSTVTYTHPHERVTFHCDISGAGSIEWLLRAGEDEALRIVASGVTRLELDASQLAWEPGGDEGFLEVRVKTDPDDPVAAEQRFWRLRVLEVGP